MYHTCRKCTDFAFSALVLLVCPWPLLPPYVVCALALAHCVACGPAQLLQPVSTQFRFPFLSLHLPPSPPSHPLCLFSFFCLLVWFPLYSPYFLVFDFWCNFLPFCSSFSLPLFSSGFQKSPKSQEAHSPRPWSQTWHSVPLLGTYPCDLFDLSFSHKQKAIPYYRCYEAVRYTRQYLFISEESFLYQVRWEADSIDSSHMDQGSNPVLPLTSCLALGKLRTISEPVSSSMNWGL